MHPLDCKSIDIISIMVSNYIIININISCRTNKNISYLLMEILVILLTKILFIEINSNNNFNNNFNSNINYRRKFIYSVY